MTSADLTSTKCLEIAARFGINVMDVISSVETQIDAPKDIADIQEDKPVIAEKTAPVAAGDAKTAAALAALQSLLSPSVDMATVEKIVTEKVAAALEGTALLRIELKRADNTEYKSDGTQHPLFGDLLTTLSVRQANGSYNNVWIAGPTGSGKTHAAKECAKAFGVPFYFNGALGMSHELVGFVDAAGNYHTTPFRQAYENGGVYLFDEVDASDNAALLALNAALANGECSFPDNPLPVARHTDFRCIGAANTFGQGATAEFIGRAKIDAAFLSRFAVKFHWTYDVALEQAISGNVEFTKRVQAARARAQAAGVKIVIDPRHSMAGAALISAGMSSDRAAALTYLAGLNSEQTRIVEGR
ncbi:AAA family ATPase [Rhizobium favelukesii]|nr:AAA family ATPase [Rhizobium favelukesii]